MSQLTGLIDALRRAELTIAFAESCTGGRLSADMTTVPGSSSVVVGSAVCYQLMAKRRVLGIDSVTEENVVTSATVQDMARAARRLFDASIGVGTTGWLSDPPPGQKLEAYYAVAGPWVVEGEPSIMWDHVSFDPESSRAENRELLVREVFQTLSVFEKFGGSR